MKIADIRKKPAKDLQKTLDSMRDEIATLSRERYIKEETNRRKIRNIRKDIARVMTVMNETEVVAAPMSKESKES